MTTLSGKTLFITGATRGIGKAIALSAARDGANVVVVGKTAQPHPRLPGTVSSAVTDLEAVGGRALGCVADVRFEEQIQSAVDQTLERFGGIDILVNNASAIALTGTQNTELKRFDLMFQVNVRAAFMCTKLCIPALRESKNPHVLNLSPPLNFEARWFAPHVAYSITKYGMSLCVLGMAKEFSAEGIAVNALWPKTVIATAAVRNLLGGDAAMARARTPEIVADAAHVILCKESRTCTGNFFIDEEVLADAGVEDFEQYAVTPGVEPIPDLFL
jgi:citronellol/citronellal dehydrogenase